MLFAQLALLEQTLVVSTAEIKGTVFDWQGLEI